MPTLTDVTTSASRINFIGNEAFPDCTALNNVHLPEVEYAGRDVFKDTLILNSLSNANPLLIFGGCLYAAYEGITNAKLSGVNCIADYAFKNCADLSEVSGTSQITRIGEGVFEGCSNLSHFPVPEGTTYIGKRAFNLCCRLTNIYIPESLTKIEYNSFLNCEDLCIDVSENNGSMKQDEFGVIYSEDGKTLVKCPQGINLKTYTVPDTVNKIGDFAFRGCNIDYIRIPDKSYDTRNYYDPRNPFEMSKAEYVIYCTEKDNVANMTLYKDRDETELVSVSNSYKGNYILADSVEEIGMYAFADNPKITAVTLNSNLEKIKDCAFENCTGIEEIIIPASVMEIGEKAFAGCVNLKTIIIEGSNTNIAADAFIHTNPDAASLAIIQSKVDNPVLHNLNCRITPATCTQSGEEYCTCSCCDFMVSIMLPRKAHNYIGYIQTGGGSYKRTCSGCGDT
ncbi:MAG: leucine-rich repeat protein, partial [Clostridia bacterium]|nr:leucine-rich repeat protein [Clostridia bacterium]